MIDSSKIDAGFIQTGHSCVLASYGIALNYFTSMPVAASFEDYCLHFGLPFATWEEAEQKYAEHFDKEWNKRKCKGYEVILDLHNNSNAPAFVAARGQFNSSFYGSVAPHNDDVEHLPRTQEAILNITFTIGIHWHSISVFADDVLLKKDTTKAGLEPLGALIDLGNLQDGLLHIKK